MSVFDQPDPKLLAERERRLAELGPQPAWWSPLKRRRWKRARAAIMAVDISRIAALYRSIYTPEWLEQQANRRGAFLELARNERP